MKRTFRSRISGAVVALALGTSALAAVGTATPASAANVSCPTTTEVAGYYSKLTYGRSNTVTARVTAACADGSTGVYAGTLAIQQSVDGGATWVTVATGSSPSYASYSHTATGSVIFRASYTGANYTAAGGNIRSYSSTVSATSVSLVVVRDVSLTSRRVRAGRPIPVTWTTNPAATGIIYAKKPGKKKFKVYKRVAVRPTGTRFKIRLPLGTKLRFVIPGDASLGTWQFQTRIKRS